MNFSNYHFVYNAAAHFAGMDRYPGGITKAITQGGLAGFEAICWALQELSTQGDLLRRDLGHEPGAVLRADYAMRHMGMHDVLNAQQVILQAIENGLRQPEDENQEVDEVLLELQKKTESQ